MATSHFLWRQVRVIHGVFTSILSICKAVVKARNLRPLETQIPHGTQRALSLLRTVPFENSDWVSLFVG